MGWITTRYITSAEAIEITYQETSSTDASINDVLNHTGQFIREINTRYQVYQKIYNFVNELGVLSPNEKNKYQPSDIKLGSIYTHILDNLGLMSKYKYDIPNTPHYLRYPVKSHEAIETIHEIAKVHKDQITYRAVKKDNQFKQDTNNQTSQDNKNIDKTDYTDPTISAAYDSKTEEDELPQINALQINDTNQSDTEYDSSVDEKDSINAIASNSPKKNKLYELSRKTRNKKRAINRIREQAKRNRYQNRSRSRSRNRNIPIKDQSYYKNKYKTKYNAKYANKYNRKNTNNPNLNKQVNYPFNQLHTLQSQYNPNYPQNNRSQYNQYNNRYQNPRQNNSFYNNNQYQNPRQDTPFYKDNQYRYNSPRNWNNQSNYNKYNNNVQYPNQRSNQFSQNYYNSNNYSNRNYGTESNNSKTTNSNNDNDNNNKPNDDNLENDDYELFLKWYNDTEQPWCNKCGRKSHRKGNCPSSERMQNRYQERLKRNYKKYAIYNQYKQHTSNNIAAISIQSPNNPNNQNPNENLSLNNEPLQNQIPQIQPPREDQLPNDTIEPRIASITQDDTIAFGDSDIDELSSESESSDSTIIEKKTSHDIHAFQVFNNQTNIPSTKQKAIKS